MAQRPVLGWPETKEEQKLRIKVIQWGYSLVFERSKNPYRTRFSWEGVVTEPPETLKGVKVLADVEEVSGDSFAWRGVLRVLKGFGLTLTLAVTPNTYQEMQRLFATVFGAGERGRVWIEVIVTSEKSNIPGFWQDGWHLDGLHVSRFGIFSGSSLSEEREDE